MRFIKLLFVTFVFTIFLIISPKKVLACTVFDVNDPNNAAYLADPCKPYYYFDNVAVNLDSSATDPYLVTVNVDTVGDTIDALQGVITYDPNYLTVSNLSIAGSICPSWTWLPASSSPPGKDITTPTPYVDNDKIVFACGIPGSGYVGIDGLVFTFKVTPLQAGSTTISFSSSSTDTKFIRVGTNLSVGGMYSHTFSIDGAPVFTPTPTPTNTATSSATPTPTVTPIITPSPTASVAATPTPIVTQTTLFDDVTVTDVTDALTTTTTTTSTDSTTTDTPLDVVEQDNTVPPPPANLTPRPAATPFNPVTASQGGNLPQQNVLDQLADNSGEVLSVKGLRDLLIPGKTKADRTVVMINFISLILFVVVLMIILWKMNANSRVAKIKSQHIHELVEGELAALESKMQIIKSKEGQEQFEDEFEKTMNHIMDSFKTKKKTKK